MFGIFFILGRAFVKIGVSVYDRKGELDRKKKAREEGRPSWIDRRGTAHHVENDEPFRIKVDLYTGHKVEVNPYTCEVVRDLTVERDNKRKIEALEKAKVEGRRVYPIGDAFEDNKETPGHKNMKGRIWIDRVTGKEYLRRVFFHVDYWYLSIETGLYEFPEEDYLTDGREHYVWRNGSPKRMILTKELIDENLDHLNRWQKQMIEKYGIDNRMIWENDKVHG